jgi:predicted Fe-S protein YdhL (DUF1289 family)
LSEITEWSSASVERRREILAAVDRRRLEDGDADPVGGGVRSR